VGTAGVNDVLPLALRRVEGHPRYDGPQRVLRADDQPELFAGVEPQTDREQIDLNIYHLAGRQLLDPIKAVGGNGIRRQQLVQVPCGHAQASGEPLYRRTDPLRSVTSWIIAP